MAVHDTFCFTCKGPAVIYKDVIGRDVWAFAYQPTNNNEGVRYHCKPVRGRVHPPVDKYHPATFRPYGKDGKTLVESKKVDFWTRAYADTEVEAIQAYNLRVRAHIVKLRELIGKAKVSLIDPNAKTRKKG